MIEVLIHTEQPAALFNSIAYLAAAWQIDRHPACRVVGIAAEKDDPRGYDDQVKITVAAEKYDVEIEQLVRDAVRGVGSGSFSIREAA